jgi:hypothetical protein
LASAPGSGRELNSSPIMFCFPSVLHGRKAIRIDTCLVSCTQQQRQTDRCLTKCRMTLALPCNFCSSLCKVRWIIVFLGISQFETQFISLSFTERPAVRHYDGSEVSVQTFIC